MEIAQKKKTRVNYGQSLEIADPLRTATTISYKLIAGKPLQAVHGQKTHIFPFYVKCMTYAYASPFVLQ